MTDFPFNNDFVFKDKNRWLGSRKDGKESEASNQCLLIAL
ncbi:hypothetical protein HMPREF9507_02830 [Enterococcus faecalis TX0309B]|nr:hypothetical protein HMPREF9507_02830 [Enterococcus faecalis TX0309B]